MVNVSANLVTVEIGVNRNAKKVSTVKTVSSSASVTMILHAIM